MALPSSQKKIAFNCFEAFLGKDIGRFGWESVLPFNFEKAKHNL